MLEKFGVELTELLAPPGPLESRLVRSQLPAEALQALERIRATVDAEYGVLERAATEIDPTLARPTQTVRQQALAGTQDIEKKLVQHLKRRQETELGQLARARTSVAPNGKPQERCPDRRAVSRPVRAGPTAAAQRQLRGLVSGRP